MNITLWPENERPREKLRLRGAEALSDAELLAIFLRCGTRGMNAVDLARALIAQFGSLGALFSAPEQAFKDCKGLGPAKFTQFMAINELARRVLAENLKEGNIINDPQSVRNYLRWRIGRQEREAFIVLFLTNQHSVLGTEEITFGTHNRVHVYPREIIRHALSHNASAIIVAHNHPSGCASASADDRQLTNTLISALNIMEIRLLDHFIITQNETLSFAEQGWI